MSSNIAIRAGHPFPLGATFDGDGVNFAVFSQYATRMTLCLFDDEGHEVLLVDLPERDGHVWHGYFPGMRPGQKYGFRAHGPYRPDEGHRFNHHKLLLDPYAKKLSGHPIWNDALFGYDVNSNALDLSKDERDSAPYMPKCVVVDPAFSWGRDAPPKTRMSETVIYEAHVKGLTAGRRDIPHAGKFLAMASDEMLDHLTDLGITAVELLPVHTSLNERFLIKKGLTNYWGYMTYGFFAPDPRFMSYGDIAEFQQMVARFHSAGIEVILDVVYNHTAEGNQMGPTLSFRGLDNASYYRLAESPRYYIDDTGTGNSINMDHPFALRLVMDSLRYWVEVMHVDGFRFDLCTTLGRTRGEFDRDGPIFRAIRQDPLLNQVKLIAEPWDIGPGGYQLGSYPAPFHEWNDKYRDQIRSVWRGDGGMINKLASRVSGSAIRFDHDGRPATSSVNFLTAHDGFTLMDTVSYNEKHNEQNGENNNDGHSHNCSDNCGVEGHTDDKAIIATRAARRRAMMATLLLSQGTPMILAGDEIGNSQQGNNNAYCQDNPIGWVDWNEPDREFYAFVKKAIAFRRSEPILGQSRFLHSRTRLVDGVPDIFWRKSDGTLMEDADWADPELKLIAVEMRMASGTPEYVVREGAVFAVFNMGAETEVALPEAPQNMRWRAALDTGHPEMPSRYAMAVETICAQSVSAFALERID
ncbi:glycogen debranching protein GlgX [Marivivens donghaensis]|uniref:Glycogen debranching protein GlgX n=1 Tax=Marivivens donghaensis TaxID=1699413 RepID=A0ABX0VU92_9RHOB|nr:glycogen debranching protein GlgX [Marivivens donghaensis]NIY71344.1 glycogen debranching protein GlgX [Marivivens donghaensis]